MRSVIVVLSCCSLAKFPKVCSLLLCSSTEACFLFRKRRRGDDKGVEEANLHNVQFFSVDSRERENRSMTTAPSRESRLTGLGRVWRRGVSLHGIWESGSLAVQNRQEMTGRTVIVNGNGEEQK